MKINLIAAVGKRGQLGLDGTLPWRDPEDLDWFRSITNYGLIVVGRNTYESVAHLQGSLGRFVIVPDRGTTREDLVRTADDLNCLSVWIAGGAKVFKSFAPVVDRFYISRVDYDGPADVWMPDRTWSAPHN